MKLEVVGISDVFPNPNNPRKKFEGIDELAASFVDGEPLQPICVVQDGGIYTLIDGERRYKAMQKLGTKQCRALIAETIDDVNIWLDALRTDETKQPLTALERSRGLQQALIFNDVERVEKASGTKNLRRVSRAIKMVDDAAEDMTIDRLLAIEENADNPELVEALTNCKESEWKKVLASAKKAAKRETAQTTAQENELDTLKNEYEDAIATARVCLAALAGKGYEMSVYEQRLLNILTEIERKKTTW